MSLQKLVVRYPKATRAIFAFGIPLIVCLFWLTVGAGIAYGQEAPGGPTASVSEWGTVPVVGTSLTASAVFYWLLGFANKAIERNDAKEREIYARHDKEIERLNERNSEDIKQYIEQLKDANKTSQYWAGLYHEVTKESVTESRRLAHLHHSSQTPQI